MGGGITFEEALVLLSTCPFALVELTTVLGTERGCKGPAPRKGGMSGTLGARRWEVMLTMLPAKEIVVDPSYRLLCEGAGRSLYCSNEKASERNECVKRM